MHRRNGAACGDIIGGFNGTCAASLYRDGDSLCHQGADTFGRDADACFILALLGADPQMCHRIPFARTALTLSRVSIRDRKAVIFGKSERDTPSPLSQLQTTKR